MKIKNNLMEHFIIMSLFLFTINFKNQPNYLFALVFSMGLIFITVKDIYIKLNLEFFLLIICFTCYLLIYNNYNYVSLQSFITFWIGPAMAYFFGYHVSDGLKGIEVEKIVFTISIGMFLHGFFNMMLYFKGGGIGRVIPDIWSGSGIAATLQGTYLTIMTSFTFYALFICRNILEKLIIIIAILFSVYSTLQTASRTILIIMLALLIMNMILYLYLNRNKNIKIIKTLIYITLTITVVILLYNFNVFGLKDIYEGSALYERINRPDQTSLNDDPRFGFYILVLSQMFRYPIGGYKILPYGHYAHNLWLDTANSVGIIPFILLTLYTFITLRTLLKFICEEGICDKTKYIIFSVYSALTLNFMVEPILEGVPYMFLMMCILNGATRKKLDYVKRRKKIEGSMAK